MQVSHPTGGRASVGVMGRPYFLRRRGRGPVIWNTRLRTVSHCGSGGCSSRYTCPPPSDFLNGFYRGQQAGRHRSSLISGH